MPPELTMNVDNTKPEVIVSAALHLISTYGCNGGCPRLAHVIVKHLRILAERRDLPPVLRATCAHLAEQWDIKLHNMLPVTAAAKPTAKIFGFKRSIH